MGIEVVDPIVTISPSPDFSQGTSFSQENLPTILGGNVKCSHSGKQAVFCKTGHTLTIEPRNLSPGYVSQRNEDYIHTKTCV